MPRVRCPSCDSTKVQKSSALYEGGTRTSEGRSTGWFLTSRGALGVGTARRITRSSSLAVQRNAPSQDIPWGPAAGMLIGSAISILPISRASDDFWNLNLGGALAWFLVALVVIAVGFFIGLIVGGQSRSVDHQQWENQWYCRTCGEIFFPRVEARHGNLGIGAARMTNGFVSPVLRVGTREASNRDLAGLAQIRATAAPDGSFNPEEIRLDLGVHSRLSSLGFVTYDRGSDRFLMTQGTDRLPIGKSSDQACKGWWQRTFG